MWQLNNYSLFIGETAILITILWLVKVHYVYNFPLSKVNHKGAVLSFQTNPSFKFNPPTFPLFTNIETKGYVPTLAEVEDILFYILENVSLFTQKTSAVQFSDKFLKEYKSPAARSLKLVWLTWPGWLRRYTDTSPLCCDLCPDLVLSFSFPSYTWLPTCPLRLLQ